MMGRQVPSVRLDDAAGGIAPFHLTIIGLRYPWPARSEEASRGAGRSIDERTVRGVPTPLLLATRVTPCDGITCS